MEEFVQNTKNRLYFTIARVLRQEIVDHFHPGDLFPGDDELAKRFGVSGGTLRQAIVSLVQEGLLVRRQGSGTYVAAKPHAGYLAIYTESDIFHPGTSLFIPLVVSQLRRRFSQANRPCRLYVGKRIPGQELGRPLSPTCEEFLTDVQADSISGVAILGTWPHDSWSRKLRDRGVPIVGQTSDLAYRVECDESAAIQKAVRNLVKSGRRRIALMGWGRASCDQVFRQELRAAGCDALTKWIRTDIHPGRTGAGWSQFREIWSAGPKKPDGLIITDDCLLGDVAMAIGELGIKVPDQLAVISHVNKGAEPFVSFPFGTMMVDPAGFADHLADMLLSLVDGKPVARPCIVIPTEYAESFTQFQSIIAR